MVCLGGIIALLQHYLLPRRSLTTKMSRHDLKRKGGVFASVFLTLKVFLMPRVWKETDLKVIYDAKKKKNLLKYNVCMHEFIKNDVKCGIVVLLMRKTGVYRQLLSLFQMCSIVLQAIIMSTESLRASLIRTTMIFFARMNSIMPC